MTTVAKVYSHAIAADAILDVAFLKKFNYLSLIASSHVTVVGKRTSVEGRLTLNKNLKNVHEKDANSPG